MPEAPTRRVSDQFPLVEEIALADSIVGWFRQLTGLRGLVFLDSARADPQLGRYSYLTADPFERMESRSVCPDGRCGSPDPARGSNPLVGLAQRMSRYRLDRVPGLPPFQGGAVGLFSYDLCRRLERLPAPRFDEFGVPELAVGLYDWVLAVDHVLERGWIFSSGFPELEPRRRARRAAERLAEVRGWLAGVGRCGRLHAPGRDRASIRSAQHALDGVPGVTSTFDRAGYVEAVERAIEHVFAGDVYQVNLSQRLLLPLREHPAELYLRLRDRNPAPFAGYFDLGDFVIASASPERFLCLDGREVETRPIKGTRPRWPVPEADMYSGGELVESAKDRSENVMIVDLLRNDLGRVCEYGSVRVINPLRLESYQFVHHLVSEVRGRLRANLSAVDLLAAAFPGGSVTGAPKIRAMEVIAELEPTARGAYCGSLGYLGFDGGLDTNILIRTFCCGRGWTQFPVGGGIVAQSDPEREYEETLHKAEGMIRALSA